MDELVRTGVAGLDEILLGGVARYNNVLVEGAPGTGKTTLGLAFIHAGAFSYNEPGIIVSFELDADKIVRDARGFDWRIDELLDAGQVKIINATPAVLLREFQSEDSVLLEQIKAMKARRLMIDGLTPLRLYAEAEGLPFRQDLHTLIEHLTALGVTTLMTAERETNGGGSAHERYVFDTIISLSRNEHRRRVTRRITIEKSRGQDFIGGSHAMDIVGRRGIRVYRRAQARPKLTQVQPTSLTRLSTGIPPLDTMMGGGIYEGSITLVTGISGTGKTVAGVQFLAESARNGRRGLLVSLDEHPSQLTRNAASLGFDLPKLVAEGSLVIHYESPLELDLDVHFNRVTELVEEHDIACIVFDSVAVYEMASPDDAADFLYALATYCKDRLATVYFNYESPELLGVSQISKELQGSHLVDNILLLNYVEISTRLRRAMVAPKVRGSRNQQVTREYVIDQGGISVLDNDPQTGQEVPQLPFSAYYGLLSRSPSRQSPVIEEAIAKGEPLPDDTVATANEQ